MILRHNTSLSWPEIAQVLGRPSHSTAITVERCAKPPEQWGPNAVYLCRLHHDAADRRDLPHAVEDWRWFEAWNEMKKDKE